MDRQRFLPHALIVLTLARFLLLASSELSPAEAQAAICADRMECWHPLTGPVLPLLMKPGMLIFGMNEFGVRFLAPLLMLAAGWIMWRTASGIFDGPVAGWAVLFFQVTPAVNLASITFTHTTLGIFYGALMLILMRLALHRTHRYHLYWWAVALAAAVAFFTDWRLIAISLAGCASMALTRRGRQAMLRWPVLPILGGTFAFALTIFLAWNSEHHWGAFHFFPDHTSGHQSNLMWREILAFGPLLPLFVWALVETSMQRPLSYEPAFLFAFTWPLLAIDIFAAHTLDWPQAGFCAWLPAVAMLTALQVLQSKHVSPRIGIWLRSVVLCITGLQSILLLQAGTTPLLRSNDKLYGWRISAKSISAALDAEHLLDGRPLHFTADRWQLAAPLSFYLHDLNTARTSREFPLVQAAPDTFGRTPESPWERPPDDVFLNPSPQDTVIYITDDETRHQARRELREKRPGSRAIAVVEVNHEGTTVRTLKVFACPPESAAHK